MRFAVPSTLRAAVCRKLLLALLVLPACGGSGYSFPETVAPTSPAAPSSGAPASPAAPATDPTKPGAQEPTPAVPSANSACTTVTWNAQIKSFFANRCLGCHSSISSMFDASDRAEVVANIDRIKAAISGGTMPPSGRLDAATQAQIQTWVGCMEP